MKSETRPLLDLECVVIDLALNALKKCKKEDVIATAYDARRHIMQFQIYGADVEKAYQAYDRIYFDRMREVRG